jgi:hypothetical protein
MTGRLKREYNAIPAPVIHPPAMNHDQGTTPTSKVFIIDTLAAIYC